jgi:hypothetical protein
MRGLGKVKGRFLCGGVENRSCALLESEVQRRLLRLRLALQQLGRGAGMSLVGE